MKKQLTILLFLTLSLSVYSQSLVVTGDTLITGDPNLRLTSHLAIANQSNATIDVRCSMTPIMQDTSTDLQFCWAGVCYPLGTLVSGQVTTLTSGQFVEFPDLPAHSGYYDAYGLPSTAVVEYCFYDDANPIDETCFTVTFDATTTGLEDKSSSVKVSEFFPNPSSEYTHIFYNESQECIVEIVDILGNRLTTTTLTKFGKQKIFIGDLPNGVYFGRLTTVNGNLLTIKKLIVKR